MPFEDDCREPDDALLLEGRRRVRASSPSLTDEQFARWVAEVRRNGGKLELTPDGVRAV